MVLTFFTSIKDKYNYLIGIGTLDTNSNNLNKKIRLLNIYIFILINLNVFFLIANKIIGGFGDSVFYSLIISIIFLILIVILNSKGGHKLSFLLYIIIIYVNIIFTCWYSLPACYLEYFFIVLPPLAISLFDSKKFNLFILFTSYTLFLLPYYYLNIYTPLEKEKLLPFSVLAIFICVFSIINYFKKLNIKNEKLLALERDKALSDKTIIENQAKELADLNEFKSHFFVNLSHEIRTPITLIKGYTGNINLKDKKTVNEEKLGVVNTQIQQIETILNNILDLSKLDSNKLVLERDKIALIPFLNKHYANFKELFNEKNIAFKLETNIYNIKIDMDAGLVSKSINNLLSNALKFTPKSGAVIINVLFNQDLEISINDNGLGIPEKDLDKIFERFYQSDNHITKSQGSGIGLSFTKSIIDTHGFFITINSKPNINTSFKITIPKEFITLEKVDTNEFNSSLNNSTALSTEPKSKSTFNKIDITKPVLLIVDDHKQMRSYLASILNQYQIIEAENGKEALTIIKNNNIDLLLTDYMMPIMNGETLVKEVKKLQLKLPIIILTARVDDFAKINMLRTGVDGYVNKPFVEEELLLSVKNSLKLYQNITEIQETLTLEEKENLSQYGQKFHKEIVDFISDHISELDFNIQDIADNLNLSLRTLNRRTKSILGLTTNQLVLQIRIERARELQIKNPLLSKKEIGYKVGVKNTTYLFDKIAEKYGSHYNLT